MWLFQKINSLIYYTFFYTKYKLLFKQIGSRTRISKPLKIDGFKNITIGNKVTIGYNTWLACLPLTGNKNCSLVIEDGSCIGNFNHIYSTSKIHIGKKVLTADKVYITDNLHSFDKVSTPILEQSIKQINEVTIGEGAWLGENVCIIGANVGKQSVVGANSVVTKDIPDYCIAVGSPAKVIKKYNFTNQTWEKV
jgi:acetyltransferase-like isoleucine patch superfamily enzyme